MKRSGFLQRKTALNRGSVGLRRSPIKKESDHPVAECKKRIQAILRDIVMITDGGCILRNYPEAGECGGYRNDGELILQAEHLVTRANSISYGDLRNIVCLCRHHHGHFKPEHGRLYWELIERYIGSERWAFIKACEAEVHAHRTHRMGLYDWQKIELALQQELRVLQLAHE